MAFRRALARNRERGLGGALAYDLTEWESDRLHTLEGGKRESVKCWMAEHHPRQKRDAEGHSPPCPDDLTRTWQLPAG